MSDSHLTGDPPPLLGSVGWYGDGSVGFQGDMIIARCLNKVCVWGGLLGGPGVYIFMKDRFFLCNVN